MKTIFKCNELYRLLAKLDRDRSSIIGLTGMYANPIHGGHIELLQEARELCNILVVAVNNDKMSEQKSGYSFMPWSHRALIISELKSVDFVVENPFPTMKELLEVMPAYFYFKGGDVNIANLHPDEKEVCERKKISICDNVGGYKTASSSDFLQKYWEYRNEKATLSKNSRVKLYQRPQDNGRWSYRHIGE